jgi:microcystin-dependent protein
MAIEGLETKADLKRFIEKTIAGNREVLGPRARVPVGVIMAFGGASTVVPGGWRLCNGDSLERVGLYAVLFRVIGTSFGAVDADHFTLPDLRGRVPVGVDGAAARLTANDTLGAASGAEKHTLITAEIPSHQHGLQRNTDAQLGAAGARVLGSGSDVQTGLTGGGGAHNNMQPYQIVQFIIKAAA